MSRTGVSMFGLIGLAIASLCFGQTGASRATSAQTNSSQARDRGLEAAEGDIALLKRLVREQGRRIAELEKNVKALQPANTEASAAHEPPTAHEVAKTIGTPLAPRNRSVRRRLAAARSFIQNPLYFPIFRLYARAAFPVGFQLWQTGSFPEAAWLGEPFSNISCSRSWARAAWAKSIKP